jgi:hypothetical protein
MRMPSVRYSMKATDVNVAEAPTKFLPDDEDAIAIGFDFVSVVHMTCVAKNEDLDNDAAFKFTPIFRCKLDYTLGSVRTHLLGDSPLGATSAFAEFRIKAPHAPGASDGGTDALEAEKQRQARALRGDLEEEPEWKILRVPDDDALTLRALGMTPDGRLFVSDAAKAADVVARDVAASTAAMRAEAVGRIEEMTDEERANFLKEGYARRSIRFDDDERLRREAQAAADASAANNARCTGASSEHGRGTCGDPEEPASSANFEIRPSARRSRRPARRRPAGPRRGRARRRGKASPRGGGPRPSHRGDGPGRRGGLRAVQAGAEAGRSAGGGRTRFGA